MHQVGKRGINFKQNIPFVKEYSIWFKEKLVKKKRYIPYISNHFTEIERKSFYKTNNQLYSVPTLYYSGSYNYLFYNLHTAKATTWVSVMVCRLFTHFKRSLEEILNSIHNMTPHSFHDRDGKGDLINILHLNKYLFSKGHFCQARWNEVLMKFRKSKLEKFRKSELLKFRKTKLDQLFVSQTVLDTTDPEDIDLHEMSYAHKWIKTNSYQTPRTLQADFCLGRLDLWRVGAFSGTENRAIRSDKGRKAHFSEPWMWGPVTKLDHPRRSWHYNNL